MFASCGSVEDTGVVSSIGVSMATGTCGLVSALAQSLDLSEDQVFGSRRLSTSSALHSSPASGWAFLFYR